MATRISNYKTGSELIAQVPMTNPPAASQEFEQILDSLLADPPDRESYFQLLEHIRSPIVFVAEELAKRYMARPVPLAELEDGFFRQIVRLWTKLAKAYAQCAENSPLDSEPSQARRFATLLHRCIHFTGMIILEHHGARRELPGGLWLDLHGHYGTAEDLRVATLPVPSLSSAHSETHCAAAYLTFVLCDMAGGYNIELRDQALVRRWAASSAGLVDLHTVAVGEKLPPFVIDLMQDIALRPSAECLRTDQIRRLEVSRLADRLSQIRQKLRQGLAPSKLGLGDDCSSTQCVRLLSHLSRQWSQARAIRKFRRHKTSGGVEICAGFEEMHYFISGAIFRQPDGSVREGPLGVANIRSHREYEQLFAFGFDSSQRAVQNRQEAIAAAYQLDTWEMVDQSANGFRLIRKVGGRKVAHGQLIALRPRDSDRFLLAQTTWLMQENRGGLTVGIRALPGLPAAVSARQVDTADGPGQLYQRAFLLSALGADAKQSLVLPAGWFRPGRVVEVFTDDAWQVRLTTVLDSGPDFERVAFDVC
ncbi:MAG: hypothetical protein LBE85_05355 [Candidatus Accumulibacter sp.]|jgi:hypothetical protein|nr:hypothetical protein [Accumulibacter sp.]